MSLYSKKTVIRDKQCRIWVNKELLIKFNNFEEKDIKHVRSAILHIKRIGKIDQNAYILR